MDAHFIGILVGGGVMGILCGLGPLIAGRRRGYKTLGLVGFLVCIVCGLVLGILLAGPVALIWTVILLTKRKPDGSAPGPNDV